MKNLIIVFDIIILMLISSDFSLCYQMKLAQARDCLIRNMNYKTEFLYTPNGLNVYTDEVDNVSDFDQLRWFILPIIDTQNNTNFYIVNTEFDKLLCTTFKRDLFNKRRNIYLENFNDLSLEKLNFKCLWSFRSNEKTLSNDDQKVTIWNVNYKEPLYAANFLYKSNFLNSKRNVFTYNSNPNSKQFFWHIIC
jgi:hypothetical protein